jgi:hypothetical protein
MSGDFQGEVWAQIRTLQSDQAVVKARQDYAFEKLKDFMDTYNHKCEETCAEISAVKDIVQEIQITQKTYNRILTRLLPFALVIFTAIVSMVVTWCAGHLGGV